MRHFPASFSFSVAMLAVGRASAAAGKASTFEPSSILVALGVGALILASIVLLPVLVLSIAWPTVVPRVEDDGESFTSDERPTIPEPSSVRRATQEARI